MVKSGICELAVKTPAAALPNRLVVANPLLSMAVYCAPASRLLPIIVEASLLKLTANMTLMAGSLVGATARLSGPNPPL